ncbi:hypothetical protein FGRMN_4902 [Fusarium graminum]|nr:hypothetical protein FGRMN_4902 [Fusarium graminum]
MQYIALHTQIPIPRLHKIHIEKGKGGIFIEMAYVDGQCLDSAWDHLSTSERDTVFGDIKQHLACLGELQPPAQDLISSAFQNPTFDCRIGARFFGPMNQSEFHSLARGHLRMEDVGPFLGQEVVKTQTTLYQTHFAHADLCPRNIIIRNGRVAAVIDWAFAGWYPEYWEFTKAHYNYFPGEDWEDYLRLALPSYETELAAERILWERLPEPGTRSISSRNGVQFEHPGSNPSITWQDKRKGRQLDDLWSLVCFQ